MTDHDPTVDLQALVMGGPELYTRAEMASASHLELADLARLWRAMGFPDAGDARAFTDADLSAMLRVAAMCERGLIDLDAMVEIARSLGQTTARLAEWQVDSLGRKIMPNQYGPLTPAEMNLLRQEVSEMLPELEELLVYVWRRQVAATLGRAMAELDGEAVQGTTATVGFADLVSFTRLSRQLDEHELGALVQLFENTSADVVHAASGRLVKTLGDEVMFVADSAEQAATIAIELHATHDRNEKVPEIRVGLSTGGILTRMGDVYGTTVNRAARYTAIARPGITVVDTATSEALQDGEEADRFSVKAMTPRPVRGFGIVRPYSVGRRENKDTKAAKETNAVKGADSVEETKAVRED